MAVVVEEFLLDLERLLRRCERIDNGAIEQRELEELSESLHRFITTISVCRTETQLPADQQGGPLLDLETNLLQWNDWLASLRVTRFRPCTATVEMEPVTVRHSGRPGRPAYEITCETLELLRDLGFSWAKVAKMFGVSQRTISRRVAEFQIWQRTEESQISDDTLLEKVREMHSQQPHAGYRLVRAALFAQGFRVSQQRVANALRQVNPILSHSRWGAMVRRRTYAVKAANSLWHIDGHHSLIRWGLVIHAGIDGYSRSASFINHKLSCLSLYSFASRTILCSRPRINAYSGDRKNLMHLREYALIRGELY